MEREAVPNPATTPDSLVAHHLPRWWGNRLMLSIDGAGLVILAVTYFYIWRNFEDWPPAKTPLPDLGVSTINVVLLVVSILPMWYVAHLAVRRDRPRVLGFWLLLCACFGIAAAVLRVMEFKAVHTRWDTDAYGTVVWVILVVHFAHILAGTLETLVMGILMCASPGIERDFVDITANAMYWYFVALSWVGLYTVVFLAPRWI
jgi:heme/copper-type cytochrome/quinol oxidase subunit 3